MANQCSDEDAGEVEHVTTADELADLIARKILDRLAAITTFPTAEDVERIRDHVSPNGVAYQNGVKAGREAAALIAEDHGEPYVADEIRDPGCHAREELARQK